MLLFGVGRAVVAVEVEQARIRAVVPVAAHIQHASAERRESLFLSFCLTWQESMIMKASGAVAPVPQGTKESSADEAVRVGRAAVAVEVEQARIRAVVPAAAHIQHKPAARSPRVVRDVGGLSCLRQMRGNSPRCSCGCSKSADVSAGRSSGSRIGVSVGGVIGVFRGVGTDIDRAAVEVYAVHPVEDVAPRVFDVPVLDGSCTVRAVSSAGMIGHDIGTAGGNCRAAAAIALADFALGVPVGVLYDVEQADGAPACVVVLIPAGAFALCAAAGRCSGDALPAETFRCAKHGRSRY